MVDGADFPRRVLLAVCGLSPQVLTETIYALAVKRKPLFIPTEIHLVTTQEGARRVRLTLLSHRPGWLGRLCRVFECFLTDMERKRLLAEAAAVLAPEDSFLMVRLDARTPVLTLGIAVPPEDPPFFYVG